MTFKRLGFGIALLGLAACATGRPSGVMPQNSLDTLVKGAQQNINSLDLALAIPCPDRGGGWTAAGTFIGAAPPTSRADFRALLAEEGAAYNDAIKAVDERIRTAKRNYAFVYSTIPEELRNQLANCGAVWPARRVYARCCCEGHDTLASKLGG